LDRCEGLASLKLLDGLEFCGSTVRMLPSTPPLPCTKTFQPRAFATRWALKKASLLDSYCPGLLNHLLFASDTKRQAAFTALAALDPSGPEPLAERMREIAPAECITTLNPLTRVGRALIVSKPRLVLEAVFGSAPNGLIGVMGRIGSQPFACSLTYALLHDLMSCQEHRARAKTLLQIAGQITEDAVRIVAGLEPPWLRAEIVCRIRSCAEFEVFRDSLVLIRRLNPCVTDEQLACSLQSLSPRASISQWVEGWLTRASQFVATPPVRDEPDFRLLNSGEDMEATARALQNCLRDKVIGAAFGRQAYVLHTPSSAVAELARLSRNHEDLWALESIHGPAHAPVSSGTVVAIIEKLSATGILIPARFREPPLMRRVSRFIGIVEYDWAGASWDYAADHAATREVLA
jgi:hypothetical protein